MNFAIRLTDSETEFMITLDLKALFSKVEALLELAVLDRAVVASFASLLPIGKSIGVPAFEEG